MTAAPIQTAPPAHANGNGAAMARRDTPTGRFQSLLDQMKPRMAAVLPKHLTAERLVKMALVAANRSPKLLQCTQVSVAQSLMVAAQLGLDCGGALGSAYLVPYENRKAGTIECQLIVGYRGMIDLARRSGQIESIAARPVFRGDEFTIEFGSDERLVHRPNLDAEPDASRLTGVYVVAKFKGGGQHIEYMSRAEIERVRRGSRAGNSGPWVEHYIEMAKKTAVRRAFKWLPMSTELADRLAVVATEDPKGDRAIAEIIDTTADEIDDAGDAGGEPEAPAAEPLGKAAAALAERLAPKPPEAPAAAAQAPKPAETHPLLAWAGFMAKAEAAAQDRGFEPPEFDAALMAFAAAYGLPEPAQAGMGMREEFVSKMAAGELDGFKDGSLSAYPNPRVEVPKTETPRRTRR